MSIQTKIVAASRLSQRSRSSLACAMELLAVAAALINEDDVAPTISADLDQSILQLSAIAYAAR